MTVVRERKHGASRDQIFIQVAITPMQNGPVVWLDPVTDEEYQSEIKKE